MVVRDILTDRRIYFMKIIDSHTHTTNSPIDAQNLLFNMDKAGTWGTCIFSGDPLYGNQKLGTTFEQRLEEVLAWTSAAPDRLFPVMWIHPDEEDIFSKIQKAVDLGIVAFKMICSDYYVYEPKSMKLLSAIAEMNKAVFFHTGILWDGRVSSNYNRPINWEHLITIKKLRFSMGHCSWPWHDECIALYGKFLNGLITNPDSGEMFFDLTPGTPKIYRRDLFNKLFTIGYDVPDNVFFGTDSVVNNYNNGGWVSSWIDFDNKIYDELGIGEKVRNKIYNENIMRFLGFTPKTFTHKMPDIDNANSWDINCDR